MDCLRIGRQGVSPARAFATHDPPPSSHERTRGQVGTHEGQPRRQQKIPEEGRARLQRNQSDCIPKPKLSSRRNQQGAATLHQAQ